MTIIEFLEARLAEDEEAAWEAVTVEGQGWFADGPFGIPEFYHVQGGYVEPVAVSLAKSAAVHVARYDPARVLREVAAKRALIKSTIKLIEQGWGYHGNEGIICADLRPMAEVYSDHPAFAEIEWE